MYQILPTLPPHFFLSAAVRFIFIIPPQFPYDVSKLASSQALAMLTVPPTHTRTLVRVWVGGGDIRGGVLTP